MPGKKMLLALAAAVVALAVGCAVTLDDAEPRALTEQETVVVESSNAFGFDLFSEVVSQTDGENVFVSPLSVSMALGMTYNGARGETASGMREALRYGDLSNPEINESYKGLIDMLTSMDDEVILEIANSIWYRQGLNVLAGFIEACETFFYAAVQALDFGSSSAAQTINDWVSESTHGLIDEIVDDPINADLMMFLINAVYFKGEWTYRFDEAETHAADFHVDDETTRTVQMMHLHGDVPIYWGDCFAAVDLPYGDEYFAMAILLPVEGHTIDDVIAQLDPASWQQMAQGFDVEEMTVEIPRFELEREYGLRPMLIALGMEQAFDDLAADFSGIEPSGELFIGKVKHKTFVRVDEVGTEAAAVTSVGMEDGSAVPDEFIANEPFVFVIHDRHSQSILFIGKMKDPG
jgi:serine protease inhibitor